MMAVLEYLATRRGELVTRQELESVIWTGMVVGYKAVTNTIIKLRRALADDARHPHIIETISKRGYRLIADVRYLPSNAPTTMTSTVAGKPSITVKPFENLGSDAEQERLADSFTNGIIVALTRVPGLVLVGDESPSMRVSRQLAVKEIGRQFGVRYVLTGSVRALGGRVRIEAELLEGGSGRYHWAQKFDRELQDIGDFFELQDEVTEEIVTALDVRLLSGEAARLVRRALKDPVALDNYYRGEDLLFSATTKLELHEARRLFEETTRLEPTSPVGYAAAALACWMSTLCFADTCPESVERAEELAREAIRLDDVTGYAHMVLAHIHLTRREYDEALMEVTSAVSDRPSCPTAYSLKAAVLTYLGRAIEAIEFAQYALRLTPVYPGLYPAILASAYYSCGRYEEAVAAADAAIGLAGNDISPYLFSAASKVALNRIDEAQQAAKEVLRIKPDFALADFAEKQPYNEPRTLERLIARLNSAGLS